MPEKTITNKRPATGLRPPKADPGQDHRYQQTVAVHMQACSIATEAVQSSGPSQAEAVPFNAAKLSITGARSSATVVKKLPLLCRGAPAAEAALEAVQFNGASLAEARARYNAASQAKAGAQSSAAVVKKLHLLCRGAPAEAAKAVQSSEASLAKAGARSSEASQAKVGARLNVAAVRRAETAAAAVVHHEEDKFTALNFGGYRGSGHILQLNHFPDVFHFFDGSVSN